MNEVTPTAFAKRGAETREGQNSGAISREANPVETGLKWPRPPRQDANARHTRSPDHLSAFHLASFIQHRKLMAVCVWLAVCLGAAYALIKPDYYTGMAVVLVGGGSGQTDVIEARGDMETLRGTLLRLAARRARLDADIAGMDEIDFPPELLQAQNYPQLPALLEGERLLFAAQRRALKESLEKLEQERNLSESRVKTLEEQIRLATVELVSVDEEMTNVEALVNRNLAPKPRLFDLQRTGAVIASRKVELESELLRVRQNITQTEQRMAEVKNKHESEVLNERQEIAGAIRDAESRRETAWNVATKSALDQRLETGMLANEIDLMTSDFIAERVVLELALDKDPSFLGRAKLPTGASAEDRLLAATAILRHYLEVKRTGAGSRIDINFRATDSEKAALIANAVAYNYLDLKEGHQRGQTAPGAEARRIAPDPTHQTSRIIRVATPPVNPSGPGLIGIVAAAATIGLLVGTVLVMLVELWNSAWATYPATRPNARGNRGQLRADKATPQLP